MASGVPPVEEDHRSPRTFVDSLTDLLVDEGHVSHGVRLVLGVHEHLMPHMQIDRLVIGVTHAALCIDARIAAL